MDTKKNIWTAYGNAFKNYFKFSGRASRYDFWAFRLVDLLVLTVFFLLAFFMQSLSFLGGIYNLLTIIPSLALLSRRLHDREKSFWLYGLVWLLIVLAMIFSSIDSYRNVKFGLGTALMIIGALSALVVSLYIFYQTLRKGDAKANKYGPATKETAAYNSRGKWLAGITVALVALISVAYGSLMVYYGKTTVKIKTETTIDQVLTLQNNIRELAQGQGYDGLSPRVAFQSGIVPQKMVSEKGLINPFDGFVDMEGSSDVFLIIYTNIPAQVCEELKQVDWGSSLISLNVKDKIPCSECPNSLCDMGWVFR